MLKTPLRGHAITMLIYTATPWQISNKFFEQRFPPQDMPLASHPQFTVQTQWRYTGDWLCSHTCKIKCNKNKLFPTQRQPPVKWYFPPFTAPESCTYKYHMSPNPTQRQYNPVHVLAPHSFKFHSNHILSVPISYVVHIQYFRMSLSIVHLTFPHLTTP